MPEPQDETRRRGTFLAEVAANDRLCDEHYLLCLHLPAFPPTRPGQFVQVQCCPPHRRAQGRLVEWPADRLPKLGQPDLVGVEALLRRPFSLAGRRDLAGGAAALEIIYRVVGSGTGWLERLSPSQPLSLLGPLGNAFALRDGKPAAALVGGGVGIPPMLYLGEALRRCGKQTWAFCGVRSANLLPLKLTGRAEPDASGKPTACLEPFAANGIETSLATDDGSLGFRGLVSEAFERWLAAAERPEERLAVYACGPEAMMRTVAEACIARGVECQLALERHMACGMGTCQSCVFKIRCGGDQGWQYKLVCADGPVFDARDVVWD